MNSYFGQIPDFFFSFSPQNTPVFKKTLRFIQHFNFVTLERGNDRQTKQNVCLHLNHWKAIGKFRIHILLKFPTFFLSFSKKCIPIFKKTRRCIQHFNFVTLEQGERQIDEAKCLFTFESVKNNRTIQNSYFANVFNFLFEFLQKRCSFLQENIKMYLLFQF